MESSLQQNFKKQVYFKYPAATMSLRSMHEDIIGLVGRSLKMSAAAKADEHTRFKLDTDKILRLQCIEAS